MSLCARDRGSCLGFPHSRRLYTDMALAPRCVATAAAAGQRLSLPSQRSSAASAAPAGSSRRRLSRRERRTERRRWLGRTFVSAARRAVALMQLLMAEELGEGAPRSAPIKRPHWRTASCVGREDRHLSGRKHLQPCSWHG